MEPDRPKRAVMSDIVSGKKPVQKQRVFEAVPEIADAQPKRETAPVRLSNHQAPVRRKRGCLLPVLALCCVACVAIAVGGLFRGADVSVAAKEFTGPVDAVVTLSRIRTKGAMQVATATRTFTEERVVPKTGTVAVESFAKGVVRFYNATAKAVSFPPKTTVISSGGSQYATARAISVPAARKGVPGQVDVPVVAVLPGSHSNGGPDDFLLAGVGKPGISIRSVQAMSGGALGSDAVADPAEIERIRTEALASFSDDSVLAARMTEQLPSSETVLPVLFPDSVPDISVEPGHEDGVHVVARKSVTILLVNRSDFGRFVGSQISVPADTQVTLPSFQGLSVTTSSLAGGSQVPDSFQIRISGTGRVVGSVDPSRIAGRLAGLHRSAAKDLLSGIPEIGSFSIRMTPLWRSVFPSDSKDISVSFKP